MPRKLIIGAHVAPKLKKHVPNSGRIIAREFNQAFDSVFVKKKGRTHLAYAPARAGVPIT